MKKYLSFTLLILSILIIYSCSENVSAPENSNTTPGEHENPDDQVNATITISPQLIKSFVGDSILITSNISKEPEEIILKQTWEVQPSGFATVDSTGKVKINDLGKATLTTFLYDESDSLLASDSAQLYSEAKMVLDSPSHVNSLAGTGNDRDPLIAVGNSPNNMHVSYDGGETWREKNTVPSHYDLRKIAKPKSNPDSVLVDYQNSDASHYSENTSGLLLLNDNLTSLQELTHPYKTPSAQVFYGFSTLAFADNYIYALTEVYSDSGGIRLYKSQDSGNTWTQNTFLDSGSSGRPSLHVDPSNSQNLYINFRNGFVFRGGYVSTDQGQAWDLWDDTDEIFDISDDGTLYGYTFAEESGNSPIQIIKSSDNAESWDVLFEEEELRPAYGSLGGFGSAGIDTYESDIIAVLLMNDSNFGHELRYSVDKGVTWQTYSLAFNNRKTFNRPLGVKILSNDDESIELLTVWKDFHARDGSQVWKHKLFYNVEESSQ